MKRYLPFIVFVNAALIILSNDVFAQGIEFHGRTSSSIYSYEDEGTHTRAYQFVRFNVKHSRYNNIRLNTFMRFLTDNKTDLDSEYRYKMYYVNLEAKNLLKGRIDLTVGRQFLHPGTVLGALDGVHTKVTVSKNLYVKLYGGVESHFQRSFKIYEADDALVYGGLFQVHKVFSSAVQLLYLQKTNTDGAFWQIGGMNFENNSIPNLQLKAQSHYDLVNSRFHRLLFAAKYNLQRKMFVTVEFKNQYPQIYSNSFFSIFEPEAYRQYRVACSYNIIGDYFLNGQMQYLQFDTETANRIFLSMFNNNSSIGLIYESGYAGEQLGVMLDYLYDITSQWTASLYMDYSKYKVQKVYEFENQISNAARISYRLNRHISVDLECQWLMNRYKKQDSRLLNHIHLSW